MKFLIVLLLVCASSYSSGAPQPPSHMHFASAEDVGMYTERLDLDFNFGVPLQNERSIQYRARIGKLWLRGSWFRSLGLGIKANAPYGWALLFELEQIHHPSGFWAQLAPGVSRNAHAVIGGTVGWSLFGLELSSEITSRETPWVLSAVLRIPIAIILLKYL